MRKIDPFSLKRPKRATEKLVVKSASNPDVEIVLNLRALDAVDAVNLASKVEELCKRHIEDGIPFYPVDGEPIQPTRELFSLACTLWAMQADAEEDGRYTPEEFVAILAVAPESFSGIMDAVNRINSKGPLNAALGAANPTGVRATEVSAKNSAEESSGP